MKKTLLMMGAVSAIVIACQTQAKDQVKDVPETEAPRESYALLGYGSKVAWGAHIVKISGCEDCHSPKVMTAMGPEPDPALRFSGHPANSSPANLDRKAIEQNGYGACNSHMTAWTGPWGISYAANLTSDVTGIGNWTEEQFFRAIRQGKLKGLESGRMLLPPMPWFNYAEMTDEELSAVFAYLKSTRPVENVVPAPEPPHSAMQ